MAEESSEEKLARLEAENKALKDQIEQRKPGQLRLKISEKGGLSVYGLGRFPVTLYKEQWTRLLDMSDDIRKFIAANEGKLKTRECRAGLSGALEHILAEGDEPLRSRVSQVRDAELILDPAQRRVVIVRNVGHRSRLHERRENDGAHDSAAWSIATRRTWRARKPLL